MAERLLVHALQLVGHRFISNVPLSHHKIVFPAICIFALKFFYFGI